MASIPKIDKKFLTWARNLIGHDVAVLQVRSNETNTVYQLKDKRNAWFLKLGMTLAPERERLAWLQDRLPVPQVTGFRTEGDRCALLTTALPGTDLAHLSAVWQAQQVVVKLVEALHTFHAVDITACPFGQTGPPSVLLHGDACLPNFIFQDDETFSGYVDLGAMRTGDMTLDLGAAVWSLQFNLGPRYGLSFLKHYGLPNADAALVERLRMQYEQG